MLYEQVATKYKAELGPRHTPLPTFYCSHCRGHYAADRFAWDEAEPPPPVMEDYVLAGQF